MDVLIIGNGGREHALAWKCAQSADVNTVYVAPGNAGTAQEEGIENIAIASDDLAGLLAFAQKENITLTIVGPEAPLVMGIVDSFNAAGMACFGPSQAAAQLEGSKIFSKNFLARHNIPTAAYQAFTDLNEAVAYVEKVGAPLVVKADGLAAGKGVIIAHTNREAVDAVHSILVDNQFGDAGASVVIEAFLVGEEASFICMADGETVVALATSQDHKAAHNGDTGPNTGGMGAYSPAPVVDDAMHRRIMDTVILPTVNGLKSEGIPYTGFLYAGVMITADGTPNVLEFNCRFGDPETQPIMMRLQSDLAQHCLAATQKKLEGETITWHKKHALGVVLAAEGYPNAYRKGEIINGLDSVENSNTKVFYAGVAQQGDDCVTTGGRVLCVTALGDSTSQAQKNAYAAVANINWQGMWHRTDIGHKAVARETNS